MNWNNKTVLVTGAGGFIGSHLCESLVRAGAKVRGLVHYNALGRWGWLDGSEAAGEVEVVAGDVTDPDSVLSATRGCDTVFHLAALIAIPYSYDAPRSYLRTNIEGTINVLRAAQGAGVARVVHTSTSEVYGTARTVPIAEDHPLQGQSPYSASKIAADKMAEAFHLSFGLPVVTVRPFNTFGPRQSARAVIPTIIAQALEGETVRLGNLHPTRDMTFVTDTAMGFMAAGTALGIEGETINLGTGREVSIGDLVDLIGRIMGKALIPADDPRRRRPEGSEVDRLLSDNTKAARLLSWRPEVSLEEGLSRTIAWISANRDRFRGGAHVL